MSTLLLKKGAFTLALFAIFSSLAMELEQPEPEHVEPIPIEQGLRFDLGYREDLAIVNRTNAPIFIHILSDIHGQSSVQLGANKRSVIDITDFWSDNPDAASDRPEVFTAALTRAPVGEAFGTILFLMNNNETDLKVILKIGSFDKTYDFNVTGVENLFFNISLANDSTKASDNFEKTNLQLFEQVKKGDKIIRASKIYSKEEKKAEVEHFTKQLELPKFKSELLGRPEIRRPEIRIEHERLLKKFEVKQPTIDELLLMQRK